jgi:NADPH-dependent curcumin reductase CurA
MNMPTSHRIFFLVFCLCADCIPDDDLQLHVQHLDCTLKENQVLVRNELLSIDPTHRIWMSDRPQYMPPVNVGDPMRALSVGIVVKSKSAKLPVGMLVTGLGLVQEYFVSSDRAVGPLDPALPHSAYLSIFSGVIGLTAWKGTYDICEAKEGKTFVVSGASGAVGSVAGQLAKLKGAKVIGICGTKEKERRCKEEYGFNGASLRENFCVHTQTFLYAYLIVSYYHDRCYKLQDRRYCSEIGRARARGRGLLLRQHGW